MVVILYCKEKKISACSVPTQFLFLYLRLVEYMDVEPTDTDCIYFLIVVKIKNNR